MIATTLCTFSRRMRKFATTNNKKTINHRQWRAKEQKDTLRVRTGSRSLKSPTHTQWSFQWLWWTTSKQTHNTHDDQNWGLGYQKRKKKTCVPRTHLEDRLWLRCWRRELEEEEVDDLSTPSPPSVKVNIETGGKFDVIRAPMEAWWCKWWLRKRIRLGNRVESDESNSRARYKISFKVSWKITIRSVGLNLDRRLDRYTNAMITWGTRGTHFGVVSRK